MTVFIIVLGFGLVLAFILIKSVDNKHTTNNTELRKKVEDNQQAIKTTTKEILGYDPFDISTHQSRRGKNGID